MITVGIVSPGAMGSAMAHALVRGGARAVATVSGRSTRTVRLADRAGIELFPDLAAVVEHSDVIVSIVPPDAAMTVVDDVTEAVGNLTSRPLVTDLNAIAPATARRIAALVSAAECDFVDGSISGPPPWKPGTTRSTCRGRAPRRSRRSRSTVWSGSSSATRWARRRP